MEVVKNQVLKSPIAMYEEYPLSLVKIAEIIHEAGREAVAQNKVVNKLSPKKPFIEFTKLDKDAKEGRILMARYLVTHRSELKKQLDLARDLA